MNKKTLVTLVKKEAKKLRELINEDERKNLSVTNLTPTSQSYCVYGQLTGSCFSDRAHKLIRKCCERVINAQSGQELYDGIINGKPTRRLLHDFRSVFSPIETFIWYKVNQRNGNNKALISYLKKETNQLKLKPF